VKPETDPEPANVRIQVLGPVRAWRDGVPLDLPSTAQRAVLALLAIAGGQPVTRAELVDALWGAHPPASAVNVLQTHIKHLRRALEPDRRRYAPSAALPMIGNGYALQVPAGAVDLFRFRRLVEEGTARQRDGAPGPAAELFGAALRLWPGAALTDVPQLGDHPKVVALAAERRSAVARYGDAMVAAGAAEEALPVLAEAVAEQPLDEAGQARLIRAYRAAGRRAQAFTAYHEVRRRLADELGVDPGPELADVHAALLRQDAAPAAGPAVASVAGSAAGEPADAAARPLAVPAQLPPDVAGFAGRLDELRQLDLMLPGPDDPGPATLVVSAVQGTAGVGKPNPEN
jgi:DNA-binding SARP family transcriptional activator